MKPDYTHRFKYYKKGVLGNILNLSLNSISFWKFKTLIFKAFTSLRLRSDIDNVLYLNWLIPKERVEHLVPTGVSLQEHNGLVIFTVLTYKHGNFAPQFLGKLRRLFGSPYQSNWRLYVEYPTKKKEEQSYS